MGSNQSRKVDEALLFPCEDDAMGDHSIPGTGFHRFRDLTQLFRELFLFLFVFFLFSYTTTVFPSLHSSQFTTPLLIYCSFISFQKRAATQNTAQKDAMRLGSNPGLKAGQGNTVRGKVSKNNGFLYFLLAVFYSSGFSVYFICYFMILSNVLVFGNHCRKDNVLELYMTITT